MISRRENVNNGFGMDELNIRLEEMIQQGTSQMTKQKIDEKNAEEVRPLDINVEDSQTSHTTKTYKRESIASRRRNRRAQKPMEVQRYNSTTKQYAIMTLPSGLLLISFILIYLYPYTLIGVVSVFMCLFVGFKYFILWLNELSDEIMKVFK